MAFYPRNTYGCNKIPMTANDNNGVKQEIKSLHKKQSDDVLDIAQLAIRKARQSPHLSDRASIHNDLLSVAFARAKKIWEHENK